MVRLSSYYDKKAGTAFPVQSTLQKCLSGCGGIVRRVYWLKRGFGQCDKCRMAQGMRGK